MVTAGVVAIAGVKRVKNGEESVKECTWEGGEITSAALLTDIFHKLIQLT